MQAYALGAAGVSLAVVTVLLLLFVTMRSGPHFGGAVFAGIAFIIAALALANSGGAAIISLVLDPTWTSRALVAAHGVVAVAIVAVRWRRR